MNKTIILIGRNGKEAARLPMPTINSNTPNPHNRIASGWIYHEGKWYGFGVAKLDGESFFYEV